MVYLRAAMLLLVLLCCALPAAAQPVPPSPRQVTVFDGLPSNTVNRMAEDRYGYLWIATNDGLARYDGRTYRVWRSEDGLRDNRIWTVLVDARNQLWIGTENAGLVRMSADRRQLHFYDRSSQPLMGTNTVWSLASTPDGSIWFGTHEAACTAWTARIACSASCPSRTIRAACLRRRCPTWPRWPMAACGSAPSMAWRAGPGPTSSVSVRTSSPAF